MTDGRYVRLLLGRATLVALEDHVAELRDILSRATLYDFAASHPQKRELAGRGAAYAVPLASGTRVVVRHNRHGGLLAPLTGDLFLPPTRAAYELATADRLRNAGIATPDVIGYAVYRAGPLLRRSDIVTREVTDSRDLAAVLVDPDAALRAAALEATTRLIRALSTAGARHHDLNVKNVLLRGEHPDLEALLLDVDRVTFGVDPDRAAARNYARLLRSARKWRAQRGARVTESELAAVGDALASSVTPSTRS